MPLFIPNNPPSPFFSQQRRRILPNINQQQKENEPPDNDSLRLFPLESESAPRPDRKAMPVNPLVHPQPQRHPIHPTGHGRANIPQQGFSMATPMIPQQPNMAAPVVPQTNMAAPVMPQPPHMTNPVMPRLPAVPASPPSNQHSPEQAVQQFRRVNRGLPDGVRYEPLDENTMQLLREKGHLPELPEPLPTVPQHSASPSAPVQNHVSPGIEAAPYHMPAPSPAKEAASLPMTPVQHDIIKIIEGLIQDERNAHIFYSHLAAAALSQNVASALEQIAKDCKLHVQHLSEMLVVQFGRGFAPQEAEINTGLEMKSAVLLALEEENKVSRTLAGLLDMVNNVEMEKIIQRIINRKVVNYNQLSRFYVA